jgi:hypothetical protein
LVYLIDGGVVVTQPGPRKTESAANVKVSKESATEFWARFPYRNQQEFEQFRAEIKEFSRTSS